MLQWQAAKEHTASRVLYEEGPQTFPPPPPPLSFYIPFLTEKVPLSYTFY